MERRNERDKWIDCHDPMSEGGISDQELFEHRVPAAAVRRLRIHGCRLFLGLCGPELGSCLKNRLAKGSAGAVVVLREQNAGNR